MKQWSFWGQKTPCVFVMTSLAALTSVSGQVKQHKDVSKQPFIWNSTSSASICLFASICWIHNDVYSKNNHNTRKEKKKNLISWKFHDIPADPLLYFKMSTPKVVFSNIDRLNFFFFKQPFLGGGANCWSLKTSTSLQMPKQGFTEGSQPTPRGVKPDWITVQ